MESEVETKITPQILLNNDWQYVNNIFVQRGNVRLGWYEKDGTIIVGYHTFPIKITTVEKLQQLQGLIGNNITTLK